MHPLSLSNQRLAQPHETFSQFSTPAGRGELGNLAKWGAPIWGTSRISQPSYRCFRSHTDRRPVVAERNSRPVLVILQGDVRIDLFAAGQAGLLLASETLMQILALGYLSRE